MVKMAKGFVCIRLTFGFQVGVLIWASLGVVHEFPQDDGKAVDVTFRCSISQSTDLSQKLGGRPVHRYKTASTNVVLLLWLWSYWTLSGFQVHPLTAVVCCWVYGVFAPVFKLPQSKAREFYLESTINQTRAGLQVPMKSQITFVNEVHSLEHK